jgi:TPR repeat protein
MEPISKQSTSILSRATATPISMNYHDNYSDEQLLDLALTLLNRNEIEAALDIYLLFMEKYNEKAMPYILLMVKDENNVSRLFNYCEELAAQGSATAMAGIGLMYEMGLGVEKSSEETLRIYKIAENMGSLIATLRIGLMHIMNDEKDYATALLQFEKADQLGIPDAAIELGFMYLKGQGVEKNPAMALMYFIKAEAENGCPLLADRIGAMYKYGNGVDVDHATALVYFRKSDKAGLPAAANRIARMYEQGHGVPQNPAMALEWYHKADKAGWPAAARNIGLLYLNGNGVAQNYTQALTYPVKAYQSGILSAARHINVLYARMNMPQA